jgi:hypothetical protein
VKLIDASGKTVFRSFAKNGNYTLDVSGLVNGIYTLQIMPSDGNVSNKKITVLH